MQRSLCWATFNARRQHLACRQLRARPPGISLCGGRHADRLCARHASPSLVQDMIEATRTRSKVPKTTRNSSEDEIASVNFLYDDIVHALQNTIDSCINYSRDQRSTRLCVGTQVYQSQWNNAMQRPLRRSRSFKVTDFGTNRKLIYDFLLVTRTNLPHILQRFQVMAAYWLKNDFFGFPKIKWLQYTSKVGKCRPISYRCPIFSGIPTPKIIKIG